MTLSPIEVESEIRNAVNAGRIATAHEQQIRFNDWVGSGYLLIDPATGAGAYKIAVGGNGSNTSGLISSVLCTLTTVIGGGVDAGVAGAVYFGFKQLIKPLFFLGAIIDLLGLIANSIYAVSQYRSIAVSWGRDSSNAYDCSNGTHGCRKY